MTPEEVCIAAMGVAGEYTDDYPTTRWTMYQRISARQRELFAHVATLDPEFYGAEVVVEVTDGAVNVAALEQSGDVYPVERIQSAYVEDRGTSEERKDGERIAVIAADDAHAFFPPRATYRSGVLRGVDGDLDGVVELLLYYSRRPRTILPDGSGVIEFLEPFQNLLVYDLAKDLIRRTATIDGDRKAAAFQLLDATEKELLNSLAEHITHGARAREGRFG